VPNTDDSGTILAKIGRAVRSLVELQVITAVGEFEITIDDEGRPAFRGGRVTSAEVLFTRINLAEGDITSYVHPSFLAGEKAELRQYHDEQVHKAAEIMDRNVRVFTELAKAFVLNLQDVIRKADERQVDATTLVEGAGEERRTDGPTGVVARGGGA